MAYWSGVAGPRFNAFVLANLRAEDALDEAAEQPGQSHRRFQHEENDALAGAVGDRPVIDGAVRDRNIARGIVTIGIVEAAVQHQHRFQPLVGVRRNGLSGSATQEARIRAPVPADPALLDAWQ
jgi:hypothetical protein